MGQTAAKRVDFVGSRFGKLTVAGKHGLTDSQHLLVDCICDCGNSCVIRWSSLNRPIHKGTLSCGCIVRARVKDITGEIFGRVLAVERAGSTSASQALWKCLCECGVEFTTKGSGLRSGFVQSCGCLNFANRSKLGKRTVRGAIEACKRPLGEAACKELIDGYRRNARNRGLEWLLSEEDTIRMFGSNCEYCGRAPSQVSGRRFNNGAFTYNGIDRVDSSKGYTLDNVVPCCKWCNWIKGRNSLSDFFENVARIALRHPEILDTVKS